MNHEWAREFLGMIGAYKGYEKSIKVFVISEKPAINLNWATDMNGIHEVFLLADNKKVLFEGKDRAMAEAAYTNTKATYLTVVE